jgi:hypothetical protein
MSQRADFTCWNPNRVQLTASDLCEALRIYRAVPRFTGLVDNSFLRVIYLMPTAESVANDAITKMIQSAKES